MPKRKPTKAQANSEKRAIKKLRALGLYTGKLDLRKKVTPAQKRALNKYSDVIAGKATVVKPKDAASYKRLFRVAGDKVIVPRRKGETIKVDKSGKIVGKRRVGNRVVNSRFTQIKHREQLSDNTTAMLFVPFIRGRSANGKPIVEWKRFPNAKMLKQFMEGYDYKDWTDYVVEEKVSKTHPYANSDALNTRLNKQLKKRKRRVHFADEENGDDE